MWYVMQAEKDAELIVGFNKSTDKEEYTSHLNNASLNEILNVEKVSNGDTFHIPTGRVHAIGAGVLLAEIQQTSNITYRIYDYNRVDVKTGEQRELHTDLALDAIDFRLYNSYNVDYNKEVNSTNLLVHSTYFKTNFITILGEIEKDYSLLDSFVIYICVEGSLEIKCKNKSYFLHKGETILLPANVNKLKLIAQNAKILEVYL